MAPLQQINEATLLRELQNNNDFFDGIVDMIPAKLYVAGNTGDEAYNPKYFKGQHKESKESRRARNKAAKRQKFDPSLAETTRETKERIQQEDKDEKNVTVINNDNDIEDNDIADKTPSHSTNDNSDKNNNNTSRVQALRAKLNAKIAQLRAQRPQSDASKVSKRAARRAEKLRRQQEAKQRNTTKPKLKTSIAIQKEQQQEEPIMKDLQHVDFGKLAGLNNSGNNNNNKSLANLGRGKNLQKLLKDAQEKKKRLEQLKSNQEEEDKERYQSILWNDTLKEARGERVKDDPTQIKKLLKRKAAKKVKSQKAWKSRMAHVSQQVQEKQKIRTHNLQQRKKLGATANLSKKRIITPDETKRSRAGFEGRKQGYLNKGGGGKGQQ